MRRSCETPADKYHKFQYQFPEKQKPSTPTDDGFTFHLERKSKLSGHAMRILEQEATTASGG